jgi:hypothetical protein
MRKVGDYQKLKYAGNPTSHTFQDEKLIFYVCKIKKRKDERLSYQLVAAPDANFCKHGIVYHALGAYVTPHFPSFVIGRA